jgi:low temperature requirement protein LtrA
MGLFIELLTPATTLEFQNRLPRYSSSHLPGRFGLITIIVLGETVAGVVSGIARGGELSMVTVVTGLLGMLLGFGLGWISLDSTARRRPRPGVLWMPSWEYLQLPLAMGITATGAGILKIVSLERNMVPGNILVLVTGAVGGR